MKKTLLNFSISFFTCFLFAIIVSLILAILKTNNALNDSASIILLTSLSIIVFFLFGFLFSLKQKKRGLINGLILSVFYLIIYFILKSFQIVETPQYLLISRIAAIMLGSIFGVNLFSKRDQTN